MFTKDSLSEANKNVSLIENKIAATHPKGGVYFSSIYTH